MKTKISLLLLSLLFVFSEMKAQDKITIGVIQYDLSDIDKSFKELHDQGFGSCELSYQKKVYTKDFAEKVKDGSFDIEGIWKKSDEEAIEELSSLKGIGVWTAEMILLFCMQRPDVFSYDDLAIQRGLRMLYHHRSIDRKRFEMYRRRFSPYGSVASLYLWAVSGGAIPELHDYAPKEKK